MIKPSSTPAICLVTALICLANGSTSLGQLVRYQLGKQVIAFEEAFESECRNPISREAVIAPLQKAVQSFFAMSLPEAERFIDLARLALLPQEQQQSVKRVISLRLRASSRWLDADNSTIEWTIDDAYERTDNLPSNLQLAFDIQSLNAANAPTSEALFDVQDLDWQSTMKLMDEGDYLIRPQFRWDDQHLNLPWIIASVSHQRGARVEAIQTWVKANATSPFRTLYQTIKLNASVLRSLSAGRYLETDYPSHRLLKQSEAWIAQCEQAIDSLAITKAGQYWLDLGKERQNGVVRIQLPRDVDAKRPFPVLVAYHGAGGSENMFFDAYGAGRIAQLAKDHGYLLIAPRQPLMGGLSSLAELLDEIAKQIPIDRSRVVVLGHSMGAGQTIQQIDKCPNTAQKAIILGGGRLISQPESWEGLKVFVGAGDKDFGKGGAEAFARSLDKVNTQKIVKVYENTEHLGIVQVALTDIFDWLDESRN
jgi:predicted esterase